MPVSTSSPAISPARVKIALDTIEHNVRTYLDETIVQPSPTYEGLWSRDTMIIVLGLLDWGYSDLALALLQTWATYQVRVDDDPAQYILLNKHRLEWTEAEISHPVGAWLDVNRGGLPTSVYIGRQSFPDGTREIYSCHPDPDSTAWWIVACARYRELTGDAASIAPLRPPLQAAMDYLIGRDSDGDLLIEQCPNEDWADHWRRHGKVTYTQAVWNAAVQGAASIGLRGPDPDAVRSATRRTLLRPSGPLDWQCPQARGKRVTQDFALLVLYGVLNVEEGRMLMQRLNRLAAPFGHRVITPSFASGRMGPYQFRRGEYQNGGIWTWLTGWEAQARALLGEREVAAQLIEGCFCPGCNRIYEWIEPRRGWRYNPDFATGAGSILSALALLAPHERKTAG